MLDKINVNKNRTDIAVGYLINLKNNKSFQ